MYDSSLKYLLIINIIRKQCYECSYKSFARWHCQFWGAVIVSVSWQVIG